MSTQEESNAQVVDRKNIADQTTAIAVVVTKLDNMGEDIKEIKETLKESKTIYVTKIEYEAEVGQLRKAVFGFAGLVITMVLIAILNSVIKR